MKLFLQIIAVLIISIHYSWSQTCTVPNFQSQNEVDDFSSTYPGCKIINGNVSIISTAITNLDGLKNVTRINGSFYINNNSALTSIAGLSGLKQIDGHINIENNDNLLTLNGLENLVSTKQNVRIVYNERLASIAALKGLTRIDGFLSIGANPALTSLTGLENLNRVWKQVAISQNNSLSDLKALDKLLYIGDYFYLGNNASLTDLAGLENLGYIGARLEITANSSLTSVTQLTQLGHTSLMIITDNRLLSDCAVQAVCNSIVHGQASVYINAKGCANTREIRSTSVCNQQPRDSVRLNAGGASFISTSGREYQEDQFYDGFGHVISRNAGNIAGTENDDLYRTQRSSESFDYAIPMIDGEYLVVLHFAEIYFGAPGGPAGGPGKRMFNIYVEGNLKFSNYDISARAGGALKAHREQFRVSITDGTLNMLFRSGGANQPAVAAIEVIPISDGFGNQTLSVSAQADAHVEDGASANTNFGSNDLLRVKDVSGGPNRRAYLRFPIEGATGTEVVSAKLRVFGYNQQASDGVFILGVGVDDDSWTENGITWNNAPTYRPATPNGRVQVNSTLKYWEIDVTEFVKEQATGDKMVSLALFEAPNRNRSVLFHSKENIPERAPQLVIVSKVPLEYDPSLRASKEERAVAIDEKSTLESSTVFPNPISGHFTVRLAESHMGNVSMNLISQEGKAHQLLFWQKGGAGPAEVDISPAHVTAGIYLLKVQSDSKTEVIKVLVGDQ